MNRDELREYFKNKELTYSDITYTDLYYFQNLLNIEFAKQCNERLVNNQPIYWERVNDAKYFKGKYNADGSLICAFLTAKGGYFTAREVISFSENGKIYFCGEAGGNNVEPVENAFMQWCDYLTSKKSDKGGNL